MLIWNRLPIIGSRGVYLSSRPEGWFLCNPAGETALGITVLEPANLAPILGVQPSQVRILADAIELTH